MANKKCNLFKNIRTYGKLKNANINCEKNH